jgi:hypothetical protein
VTSSSRVNRYERKAKERPVEDLNLNRELFRFTSLIISYKTAPKEKLVKREVNFPISSYVTKLNWSQR